MSGQVTIDVDLGKLANEWDVVAIRPAKTGEIIMSPGRQYAACTLATCADVGPQVIVRRRWQWPACLKCAAIAMDADKTWWAYSSPPKRGVKHWRIAEGHNAQLFSWQIDLPVVDDWRESLRLNPHREKST